MSKENEIVSYGFVGCESAKTRSIAYVKECSPTLNALHYTDVLTNRDVVSIEGNGQRKSHKGDGYHTDDTMYTLNTTEVHAVAFEPGIARRDGSESRFSNDISPTLRANSGDNKPAVAFQLCGDRDNPSVSTCDSAFCINANAMSDRQQAVAYGFDSYNQEVFAGVSQTLKASEGGDSYPKVVSFDRSSYNQGINAKFDIGISDDGTAHTVLNRGPGGGVLCYDGQGCQSYKDRYPCLQAGRADDHHVGVIVYER